jgi:hypothetical protein
VNEINVNKNTHPNPLSKMIPMAILLNSGIKSLSTARKVNRVYPKSPVKSANTNTTFVKSTQTGKKTFYENKVYNNLKWTPKISKPAVATAMPKVSTGGSVNNKRVKLGNAVKASARWEWKPKGINTSINPNGVSMTFDRYNYIDTRGRSKSFVAWVPKRN